MHPSLNLILDLTIIVAAALSGLFWYQASRQKVRRISRGESLDSHDLNRIIVAFNRTQILNRRAALATALAGILAAMRLSTDLIA